MNNTIRTEVFIAGKELNRDELKAYRDELMRRVAARTSHGHTVDNNSTTRAIQDAVNRYNEILNSGSKHEATVTI